MKSILLYICRTRAQVTLTEEERLVACHRKQLKKILNIRYPKKIKKNIALRNQPRKANVNTNPIGSLKFLWSCSTKKQNHSRNKATRAYFIPNCNKLRERPKTTLPIVFNRDRKLIQHPIRSLSSKDLAEIIDLAHGWKRWRGLAA